MPITNQPHPLVHGIVSSTTPLEAVFDGGATAIPCTAPGWYTTPTVGDSLYAIKQGAQLLVVFAANGGTPPPPTPFVVNSSITILADGTDAGPITGAETDFYIGFATQGGTSLLVMLGGQHAEATNVSDGATTFIYGQKSQDFVDENFPSVQMWWLDDVPAGTENLEVDFIVVTTEAADFSALTEVAMVYELSTPPGYMLRTCLSETPNQRGLEDELWGAQTNYTADALDAVVAVVTDANDPSAGGGVHMPISSNPSAVTGWTVIPGDYGTLQTNKLTSLDNTSGAALLSPPLTDTDLSNVFATVAPVRTAGEEYNFGWENEAEIRTYGVISIIGGIGPPELRDPFHRADGVLTTAPAPGSQTYLAGSSPLAHIVSDVLKAEAVPTTTSVGMAFVDTGAGQGQIVEHAIGSPGAWVDGNTYWNLYLRVTTAGGDQTDSYQGYYVANASTGAFVTAGIRRQDSGAHTTLASISAGTAGAPPDGFPKRLSFAIDTDGNLKLSGNAFEGSVALYASDNTKTGHFAGVEIDGTQTISELRVRYGDFVTP